MPLSESSQLEAPQRTLPSARFAIAVLAVCCLCWGFSFPAAQVAADRLERAVLIQAGDFSTSLGLKATYNGWRFLLAALIYGLLLWPRRERPTAADWRAGLTVGSFLAAAMFLQLAGLGYTLPSVSAFLTAVAVVFAPLAEARLFHRPVVALVWLAVVVAIVGMAMLSWPNPAATAANTLRQVPPLPLFGETLTVLSALLFTAQIIAVDRLAPRANVRRLTCIMFAVAGLVNAGIGLALAGTAPYALAVFTALARDAAFCLASAGLVLIASVLALHLMNVYQPAISPAIACVVYCLEPLFGTAFSVLFRTESLTTLTLAGGAVVLLAVLIVSRATPTELPINADGRG